MEEWGLWGCGCCLPVMASLTHVIGHAHRQALHILQQQLCSPSDLSCLSVLALHEVGKDLLNSFWSESSFETGEQGRMPRHYSCSQPQLNKQQTYYWYLLFVSNNSTPGQYCKSLKPIDSQQQNVPHLNNI